LFFKTLKETVDADAQRLCTIAFPWQMGKYKYKHFAHGYQDCLVPDVFQNIMSNFFQDMKYIKNNMLS
jgi:hypothetical protein